MQDSIISLQDRIKEIINYSYYLFCNKVVNGGLVIHNEASMQLYLGSILQQIGTLHQFCKDEYCAVELEVPEQIENTQKSSNGKARCDIKITLHNKTSKAEGFIELKYFRKHTNEPVTDNKFSLYCDIENLENYLTISSDRICYEILYTDNINYTMIKSDKKFCIGNNHTIIAGQYQYTKDKNVHIKKDYTLNWNIYEINKDREQYHCFLKINT